MTTSGHLSVAARRYGKTATTKIETAIKATRPCLSARSCIAYFLDAGVPHQRCAGRFGWLLSGAGALPDLPARYAQRCLTE
jgi:hypothetical protein